jgi:hypothetical protein
VSTSAGGGGPRLRQRADPRRILLDAVVPEVFLSLLRNAGYDLAAPLCRAVGGTPGKSPNPVHRLAAPILNVSGRVMTTNWDSWVEDACKGVTNGPALVPRVCPIDEPPAAAWQTLPRTPTMVGRVRGAAVQTALTVDLHLCPPTRVILTACVGRMSMRSCPGVLLLGAN